MKKLLLLTILITLLSCNIFAQSYRCATMKHHEKRIIKDPTLITRMRQSELRTQNWIEVISKSKVSQQIISIPVVVHVLWHDPIENISDEQIQSQIDILNDDFRLMNADSLDDNHPFWIYASDTEIEFCLASRDPDGNATDGITRTYTDSVSFVGDGSEKSSATGGIDNWDPTEYLNIWVCNLDGSGGTLGYAAFPADLSTNPDEDGVVIRYEAFGDIGTAGTGNFAQNDLGRTATHEVGHWLNLRHIWGDDTCGDDFVADTKTSETSNYGCPSFPHNANSTCGTDADGEMYMNYMDYVDDACMNMFTEGQAIRMQAALNGDRNGLLNSLGCTPPIGINELTPLKTNKNYPNPFSDITTIEFQLQENASVQLEIYDFTGRKITELVNTKLSPGIYKTVFKAGDLSSGIYFSKLTVDGRITMGKLVLNK